RVWQRQYAELRALRGSNTEIGALQFSKIQFHHDMPCDLVGGAVVLMCRTGGVDDATRRRFGIVGIMNVIAGCQRQVCRYDAMRRKPAALHDTPEVGACNDFLAGIAALCETDPAVQVVIEA